MALKWSGILVAAVMATLTVTANLFNTGRPGVPTILNVVGIAALVGAVVVAIAAELYSRIDTKLNGLTELVRERFDRLDAETGDRNSGFVEGYLLSHGPEASVIPMPNRPGRRANE